MTFTPRDQYGDWEDSEPYEEAMTMAIEALNCSEIPNGSTLKNLKKPNKNCEVDIISRQDAIEAVAKLKIAEEDNNYPDYAYNAGIETAKKTLELMLSADAEEYINEKEGTNMDSKRNDIRKCPFCGSEAELHHFKTELALFSQEASMVRCEKCGARGPSFKAALERCADDEAVKGWNRRTETT